ncbi:MAG: hypothetical protein QNJ42_16190 [Crocosphaera sp.]|nr:hypothetical protein [Crocosphaera sp.]
MQTISITVIVGVSPGILFGWQEVDAVYGETAGKKVHQYSKSRTTTQH